MLRRWLVMLRRWLVMLRRWLVMLWRVGLRFGRHLLLLLLLLLLLHPRRCVVRTWLAGPVRCRRWQRRPCGRRRSSVTRTGVLRMVERGRRGLFTTALWLRASRHRRRCLAGIVPEGRRTCSHVRRQPWVGHRPASHRRPTGNPGRRPMRKVWRRKARRAHWRRQHAGRCAGRRRPRHARHVRRRHTRHVRRRQPRRVGVHVSRCVAACEGEDTR